MFFETFVDFSLCLLYIIFSLLLILYLLIFRTFSVLIPITIKIDLEEQNIDLSFLILIILHLCFVALVFLSIDHLSFLIITKIHLSIYLYQLQLPWMIIFVIELLYTKIHIIRILSIKTILFQELCSFYLLQWLIVVSVRVSI